MKVDNRNGIVNGSITDNSRKKTNIKIGISIGTVAVVVLIVFLLKGGGNDSKNILGVWDSDNGYIMEFMSDGTVRQGDNDGWDKTGTYEVLEDGLLRIGDNYSSLSGEYTYFDIQIKENNMTLADHDNPVNIVHLIKRK